MEKYIESPYLTTEETSAYFGIALNTLYKFTSSGELEHSKKEKLFFIREQLDDFMTACKRGGVSR